MQGEPDDRPPHPLKPARACAKLAGVAALVALVLAGAILFIDRGFLSWLQHRLTLWLVIGIVAAINIAAVAFFVVSWVAYRWIKRDLDPAWEE